MREFSTGEIPLNKDQLFVERRPQGDYAVWTELAEGE